MRKHFVFALLLAGIAGYAQTSLNNDTLLHSYSLPVMCPGNTTQAQSECLRHNNSSLYGAGSVMPETDLNPGKGVFYVRLTDAATVNASKTYHPDPSGGANENIFDATNQRIVITESGNVQIVYSLDPNPQSQTYLKTQKLYGMNHYINTTTAWFSKVPPTIGTVSLFYDLERVNVGGVVHPVIKSYDFSSTTIAPTGQTVADLDTAPNCLGTSFNAAYNGILTVSDDDQTFSTVLSNTGGQDTSCFAVVYNRTLGCRYLNTCTQQTGGNWGTIGMTDDTTNNGSPALYYIHNVTMTHDGANVLISSQLPNDCISLLSKGTCGQYFAFFVWENGLPSVADPTPTGLHIGSRDSGDNCGHQTEGYAHIINKCIRSNSDGVFTVFERAIYPSTNLRPSPHAPILDPGWTGSPCYTGTTYLVCPSDDSHMSWNNAISGNDNEPIYGTTYVQSSPAVNGAIPDVPTWSWDNEVFALLTSCWVNGNLSSCNGNKLYNVAHTYSDPSSANSAGFDDYIAVGSVSSHSSYSQHFYAFTSNWQGQLGCTDGTYTTPCRPVNGSPSMRYDAFVVAIPD
jgi:hypothetical protein